MKRIDTDALLGKPYEVDGRGPHTFDCYGLVMHCYREWHGVALPDFKSPKDADRVAELMRGKRMADWAPAARAAGAVANIRIGKYHWHCAFLLDSNRLLHTWEKSGGVLIERVDDWERAKRIEGYYRYVG